MDDFEAVADPVRREILVQLRAGALSAGTIAEHFSISRPAVSRHLRVLRETDLVTSEVRGREHLYRLAPRPFHQIESWLAQFGRDWGQALDALETEVHRTRRDRRSAPRSSPTTREESA
jgi:DNA-binding transcriptional ArsR family regulator